MAKKKQPTLTPETQQIATTSNNVAYPVFGDTLTPQDDTLLSRGQGKGLKIYDDIERDTHAYAVLQKRRLAVVSREWRVDPASDNAQDIEAAEGITRFLKQIPFDRICLDLLDAVLKGFAVGEAMWDLSDGYHLIKDVVAVDQRRIVFDKDSKPRLLTPANRMNGIELPERKFIIHQWGSKNGDPYGLGLGTRLFWPVFFKRQGIKFWLTFADKYGDPTMVGKYRPGTSPELQSKLLSALYALQRHKAITIPDDMQINFLEAQRYGTINTYEQLVRWCDEQISECVLGETLTTNLGGDGSRAATETHNEVRLEISKADADLLSATINRTIITWLTEVNFPRAKPPQVWRTFTEKEDLDKRAARDKILFEAGYRPKDVSYINETYGGDWVDTKAGTDPNKDAAFALTPDGVRDSIDDLRDLMLQDWHGQDDPLAVIQEAVAAATSFDDLKDRLAKAIPQMKADDLIELLARGMFVTKIAGLSGLPINDG